MGYDDYEHDGYKEVTIGQTIGLLCNAIEVLEDIINKKNVTNEACDIAENIIREFKEKFSDHTVDNFIVS